MSDRIEPCLESSPPRASSEQFAETAKIHTSGETLYPGMAPPAPPFENQFIEWKAPYSTGSTSEDPTSSGLTRIDKTTGVAECHAQIIQTTASANEHQFLRSWFECFGAFTQRPILRKLNVHAAFNVNRRYAHLTIRDGTGPSTLDLLMYQHLWFKVWKWD